MAVSPKANRRFYELIVLLQALNKAYKDSANRKAVDLARGTEQEPDEMFRNFVSKLSQICDARPGGFTVTSFAVLQFPDKVQYVFGSNQRSTVELETVKAYISSILSSLRDISTSGENEEGEAFLAPLLRDILIFNHGRIKNYISKLVRALETCIAICGSEVTRGGQSSLLLRRTKYSRTKRYKYRPIERNFNSYWTLRCFPCNPTPMKKSASCSPS